MPTPNPNHMIIVTYSHNILRRISQQLKQKRLSRSRHHVIEDSPLSSKIIFQDAGNTAYVRTRIVVDMLHVQRIGTSISVQLRKQAGKRQLGLCLDI